MADVCRDGSGEPLAECTVSVGRESSDQQETWTAPAEVRSAADGTFEIRYLPPGQRSVDVRVALGGRAPCHVALGVLEPGVTADVGDLRLRVAREVRGRVVDQHRAPYGGLDVRIEGELDARLSFRRVARSGADGSFRFAEGVPHGVWPLRVSEPEREYTDIPEVLAPARLVVGELGPEPIVEVTVVRAGPIAGQVVDERGEVVTGAVVFPTSGTWRGDFAPCYQDGRFEIVRRARAPPSVRIEVVAAGGFEGVASSEEFTWGTQDVRVVVRRPETCSVSVEVVEEGTRRPISNYHLYVESEEARSFCVPTSGVCDEPAGTLTCATIRPGRNLATISLGIFGDRSLVPPDPVQVRRRGGTASESDHGSQEGGSRPRARRGNRWGTGPPCVGGTAGSTGAREAARLAGVPGDGRPRDGR